MPRLTFLLSLAALLLAYMPTSAVADEPFLSYERVQSMATGSGVDNRYILRWWTDGRVEIRVPAHARQAGEYELLPGEYDFEGLEEILKSTETYQSDFQAVPATLHHLRSQEMREVHDADRVRIRTHSLGRAPVDIEAGSPDHWVRAYPQSQVLSRVARIDQRLMEWITAHAGMQ